MILHLSLQHFPPIEVACLDLLECSSNAFLYRVLQRFTSLLLRRIYLYHTPIKC